MPEGPEVRREADRIAKVIAGKPLESVFFGQAHMKASADALIDAQVLTVQTHGKAMLTHFDNGYTVYSHNQLYGKWFIRRRGKVIATKRQLRFGLYTQTHCALLYSASSIELWETGQLAEHPFLRKLGPDVLDKKLEWREVAERLKQPEFRRRALSALYLDQGYLAGIGNYMRSEILYAAGLAPTLKPQQLGQGQLGALARATLMISQRAYATAGITNAPSNVARMRREGLSRRQYRFAVFDRDGEPCLRCGCIIEKIVASRRLYLCPSCQPES